MSARARRLFNRAFGAGALILASPMIAPQLLAFPYHATSHGSEVWSETPLRQTELDAVMGRAATLVAASPLARAAEPRRVFLTQGGWRWKWLALQSRGSLAITRAAGGAVLVNRSDLARDRMTTAGRASATRTLSGIIAHETCHGMERHHFGVIKADVMAPQWLREGYCDHVAQESTLTAADVARLKADGESHPGVVYFHGRQRVAALLSRNGGNVRALFD